MDWPRGKVSYPWSNVVFFVAKKLVMNFLKLLLPFCAIVLITNCTPKVVEQTTTTEPEQPTSNVAPPKPDEKLSPCPKFQDARNPDEAETNYVLYRDFLKVNEWDKAFGYWQKVYQEAPAADGRRNTVYSDGIRFYEYFISQTTDEAKKEEYIAEIFSIYDEILNCYPEGGYVPARKAFDYYYKYPNRKTKEEIYNLFKIAIDTDRDKTNDFVVNPFAALLVDLHDEGKVSNEEASRYDKVLRDLITNGLKDCKGVACERWKIIEEYAPIRLSNYFETVKGFYDCEYYMAKYYKEFEENQDDCDIIRTVYSRLKWGGCDSESEPMRAIVKVGAAKCVEESTVRVAYDCLQNADYDCAVKEFEKAANEEEDAVKKSKYLLLIAKIYNAHLKNFSKSRQYALRAAEARSGWGEPYILIGRLYASSGPLCGPGRGWDSQIVTWPAIDMWSKAKRVDPSVSSEANKWIGRYRQYMPTKEDIFIRNLKEGQSFRVGCWIQETTTIRAAP